VVELLYVAVFVEHPAAVSKAAKIAMAANKRAIGLSWSTNISFARGYPFRLSRVPRKFVQSS
jgi:hypothetical protein